MQTPTNLLYLASYPSFILWSHSDLRHQSHSQSSSHACEKSAVCNKLPQIHSYVHRLLQCVPKAFCTASISHAVLLLLGHFLAFQYFATEWHPFQEVSMATTHLPTFYALVSPTHWQFQSCQVTWAVNTHAMSRPSFRKL